MMEVKNNLLNFTGKIIYQNSEWFNFSLDSVLLANFVKISPKDKMILDMATGNAPIPMLLTYRTSATIVGVELQEKVYELAKKSVYENKMEDQIKLINDDVKNVFSYYNNNSFDVITCNPPYFKYNANSNINQNEIKAIARHEKYLTLEEVITIASKLLKKGGKLALIHRTDRLIEIIEILRKNQLEPKRIIFIYPKVGGSCKLFFIESTKNGKSGLKILEPFYVHDKNGNYSKKMKSMFGDDKI